MGRNSAWARRLPAELIRKLHYPQFVNFKTFSYVLKPIHIALISHLPQYVGEVVFLGGLKYLTGLLQCILEAFARSCTMY